MSIKHILLPLTGEANGASTALCAVSLALAHQAHVSAGYEDELTQRYMPTIGYIASRETFGAFYEQMQAARREHKALARGFFDAAVAKHHIPIVSGPQCPRASCMWIDDHKTSLLATQGLFADLAVLGIPGEQKSQALWSIVEEYLFHMQRPALLVPTGCETINFTRPVVAWNGSRQALSAVRQALPLFAPETHVTILQVGEPRRDGLPASGLADYLGWHCVGSEIVAVEDQPRSTAAIIFAHARAAGASCIVMGAFTRSPTRQFLLGGVTNYVLGHASLPVFMSH